jgi:ADP-L-glycero-D-manno-heptose 6-epimerase
MFPPNYLRTMIVVTGAAGFIGSVLAVRLLEADYRQIVLVDDFSVESKRPNHHHLPVTERVDRADFPTWLRANESQVQFIFHLGARTDTTEQDEALLNALNLEYSKEIWRLCVEFGLPLAYASSAATYGDGTLGYVDSHDVVKDLKPLNPYGRSKNDFDAWALAQERKPYFWAGFKFFNVYGPNEFHKGRMASVVLHTFRQVQATGAMKLFRSHRSDFADGHQTRDFVHVEDVCSVLLHFMHHRIPQHSGLYNLGSGHGRTFLDLATATFRAMGREPVLSFIDTPEDIRDTYQYFTQADLTKLRANGYTEPFRSLEDGIDDYVKNHLITGETRAPREASGGSA